MHFQTISYTSGNKRAEIILNRPDKRNAFNAMLVSELKEAFRLAAGDDGVKVIVLKAAGEVFSAGADLAYLQSLQSNTMEENEADSKHLMGLYKLIYTLQKPVIAQIEGHAIAGGCGLASVCDFSFAVPEARFGYTEVRIGFIPAIVMVFLLRKVNERNARELLLTGKLITAEEAKHMGLINAVVAKENIAAEVQSLCDELITHTSRSAVQMTKQMIAEIQELSLGDALHHAARMNAKARNTPDCQHGIKSFLNKQKPDWD